jgi:signal transduction histidine kinase
MRPRVKIAGMLSIAAAGLVAAVFCVSAIGARAMAEEESARREMEVLYQLQRLQTAAVTASAQIRGYFLTGDEGFTAGIREAVTAFDEGLKTLHTRLSQTSHRLADAQKIAVLEASREERIYGTMARFRSHAISPQELRTVLRSAEEERQAIGARLLKIQVEANRLSGEHLALRDRLSSAARVTAWSGALVLIALLAAVWGVFDSGVMAGMGRLKEQVARLDAAGRMNPAALDRGELQVMAETVGRGAELLDEQTRLLDRAVHGIARVDPAGHFLSHNRAFDELWGEPGADAPDQLLACIHGDDWETVEGAREAAWTGARQETGARLVRPDGSTTEVVISFVRAGEDAGRGQFVVIRDNSRQKQKEAELIGARNAAVGANTAKTRFLAKVTHDIRTPLNAILGASALLSQTSLSAEQLEYVSMFLRNSERLV